MPLRHEKHIVFTRFDRIAHAYDLMTALNPGYGKHLRWSAERMNLPASASILDLCCGTGLSTAALLRVYPRARITGLDASSEMLAAARAKPELAPVDWVRGDAMDPAAAGAAGPYHGVLMAYGIRNVPDPDLCLERLLGILRPGGTICFHEYSVADSRAGKLIWNAVSSALIRPTAMIFTRRPELFRYLKQSVNAFDGVSAFEDRLWRAGFTDVRTAPMDGWQRGIVHSFLARRPR